MPVPFPPGPPVPPASAVVFDLDDTLVVEVAAARASVRAAVSLLEDVDPEVAERAVLDTAQRLWESGPYHVLCLELGFAPWEGLWSDFSGCHRRVDGLRAWVPSYREQTWQTALAALAVDDRRRAADLAETFAAAQRDAHRRVEGADVLVRGLHGRYRLGLLTNGPSDIQRHKLRAAGLADCFDAVVVSGEVGAGKPAAAVFELVLDRLGVLPTAAVMVGDSWERDVRGATAAGLAAVWVRGDQPDQDGRGAVPVIAGVADLADVLEGVETPPPPGVVAKR